MAKEKLTPDRRAVPSSGGNKQPEHSTLTTPKQPIDGKVPWGKESNEKIL